MKDIVLAIENIINKKIKYGSYGILNFTKISIYDVIKAINEDKSITKKLK